jgi:short-subunit dehydrogenase involved in D-alanine esterification of teichoic acids
MKKLLTFLFLVTASVLVAQELTADTPATVDWLGEILKALLIAVVSLLGFVAKNVLPLVNQWLKAVMHFRGSSVVADALTVALVEMADELQKAMADGKLSAEEKAHLKLRAREIAAEKLKNLSGFYKKDLMGWLDEVLEVELGKLLSRIFGSNSSSSSIR